MPMRSQDGDRKGTSAPTYQIVFFRMAFLAREMCIHPDDEVRFEDVGAHAVSVDFTNAGASEARILWRSSCVRCTATMKRRLPRRAYAVYDAVWAGKFPDEVDPEYPLVGVGEWRPSHAPAYFGACAPAFLNEAITSVEAEITNAVTRLVGLVRWRCNRTGPVDLPSLGPHEWSIDGETWKPDVRPTMPIASAGPDLVVSDVRKSDLEQLLQAGDDEPLYHSLLREAQSLVRDNPRSAVAIGATAAEVAVKTLVSKLAPHTSWLVQNLPSPPIFKLLGEYLPTLLPPESPRFDKELIASLRSAVSLRNTLMHGIQKPAEPVDVASALATFSDIVWLCDYFAGVAWAVNRVSQRTVVAMDLATTVDTSSWFVD